MRGAREVVLLLPYIYCLVSSCPAVSHEVIEKGWTTCLCPCSVDLSTIQPIHSIIITQLPIASTEIP